MSSKSGRRDNGKRARKACASCRKAKSSCSDQRPCARCSRLGKRCVDRELTNVEWSIVEGMGMDVSEPSLIDYMDLSPVSPSPSDNDDSEAFVLALAVNERNVHLQREVERLQKEVQLARKATSRPELPAPPAAVSQWSPLDGRLLSCDEKFAALCQRGREELMGFSCSHLICQNDLEACHRVVQLLVDGTITNATIEQRWILPSGQESHVSSVLSLLSPPGDAPRVKMETSVLDNTSRQAQGQLNCGDSLQNGFVEDPIVEILRLSRSDS